MPGTNEPAAAVVAEPTTTTTEQVEEAKTALNGVEGRADKDAGDGDSKGADGDTENSVKASGDVEKGVGGDGEKAENGGEKAGGDTENGDKVKTPTKEDYETGAALLAQGKRHLYVKDYPEAVAALSAACAKLDAEHGYKADVCADAYFYYASSLLELARENMAVLGEPAAANQEEEEEEEGEDEEEEEEGGDETLEASKLAEEGKKEDNGEDQDQDQDQEQQNVNDLQLAWEMFDLARMIYEKQNEEKKLADTYLKLGEVAMESENYDGAVEEMNKCLALQHKMLSADNRAIAETLFQLGVASSLCNQFDEAIKYFTNAGAVLDRRIRTLTAGKSQPSADAESVKRDPFYTVEKEIEELRTLLPEIKDKIADMEDFKREALKALREDLNSRMAAAGMTKDGAGSSSSAAASSSSSSTSAAATTTADVSAASSSPSKGPANDISHLIRKKRKADEVVTEKEESSEAKKPNVGTVSSSS